MFNTERGKERERGERERKMFKREKFRVGCLRERETCERDVK